MATMANTVQQKFAAQALIALSEMQAMGLVKFCEKGNAKGGESYTFYRYRGAKAKDGLPSMYTSDATKAYEGDSGSGDGGEFEKFKVDIKVISTQHKLSETDMNKTSLNAKDTLVRGMGLALARKEDNEVLQAIINKQSELKKVDFSGGAAKPLTEKSVFTKLVGRISASHARAKMTPDGKQGVTVVMHIDDWETLSESDLFLMDDYQDAIKYGNNEVPTRLRGAEILISEAVAKGTLYIVPSNTCGFASWDNSVKTDAEFHPTDGRRWHLQLSESVGAICIEPKYITEFKFKTV